MKNTDICHYSTKRGWMKSPIIIWMTDESSHACSQGALSQDACFKFRGFKFERPVNTALSRE